MGQRDAESPRFEDATRAAHEPTQPAFAPASRPARHAQTQPGRHARVPVPPSVVNESTEPLAVVDSVGGPPPMGATLIPRRPRERLIIGIAVGAAAIAFVIPTTIIVSSRDSRESARPS